MESSENKNAAVSPAHEPDASPKAVKMSENKMGTMPVPKLLVSMSLPMVASMLVQALYNVVDSIFVSKFDQAAMTAVTLAFPAQTLLIASAVGTGVGINALLSYNLGKKDQKGVNNAASHGIFLYTLYAVIFCVLGFTLTGPFIRSQFAAKDFAENYDLTMKTIGYGKDYLSIVMGCSVGMFFQILLERLLQSTGKTIYSMITQGTGAVVNIILDYALVFGHFGLPRMGVKGAAIATVIGQCVAAFIALYFNLRKNKEVSLSMRGFHLNGATIRNIYKVAFPSILMQAIASVITFILNKLLAGFTMDAVTVFGIYFRIQSFIFMPVFGFNSGMVPILAYNYGARRKKRMLETLRLSYFIAAGIMVVGTILFWAIPEQLLSLFSEDAESLEKLVLYGKPAFHYISLHFIAASFSIITISVFQALGNGLYATIVSVCRQVVILLPVAWFMAKVVKRLDFVWLSYPIAEIASALLCAFFLMRIYRKQISPLPE